MVVWIIFALLSACSMAISALVHRKVMITEDPFAYAMIENLFVALVFLLFINHFEFPNSYLPWILVLISSFLWLGISIISQFAYKYTSITLKEPISQSRIFLVFLFGVIFLGEAITLNKIFGSILIFIGILVVSYKKYGKFGTLTDKGVIYTLISSFLFALVVIVDKKAMDFFNAETYGFLVYLIPGLMLLLINRNKKNDKIFSLIKNFWWAILIIMFSGFGFYYFKLRALELVDVSLAFPVLRTASIFTMIGGIIILKERDNLLKKIISITLVFIGVILLSI